MAGEVTKEQLEAFMSIYKESNVLFEKLLTTQTTLIEQQEKIVGRLYNGLAKDVASEITRQINDCSKNCCEKVNGLDKVISDPENENSVVHKLNAIKSDTNNTQGNIKLSTYFIGIIALVTIIATVLVNVMTKRIEDRKIIKQQVEEIISESRIK